MELCERITDGDQLPLGLKPAVKKNLASFVGVIRKLRRAAQSVSYPIWDCHGADIQGTSVADLLRMIIEKTGYEEHLRKTQSDFDSRWENVQELVNRHVVTAITCILIIDLLQCDSLRRTESRSEPRNLRRILHPSISSNGGYRQPNPQTRR